MAAVNTLDNRAASSDDGYSHFFAITPHDVNELDYVTRGIAFGTAGDLAVTTIDDVEVILPNGMLAANVIHKIRVKRVKATGTAALVIWGFI
jgi:hypothetical protein